MDEVSNQESYVTRRKLIKDIWETSSSGRAKEQEIYKRKIIKTMKSNNLLEIEQRKKERLKQLRKACKHALTSILCDPNVKTDKWRKLEKLRQNDEWRPQQKKRKTTHVKKKPTRKNTNSSSRRDSATANIENHPMKVNMDTKSTDNVKTVKCASNKSIVNTVLDTFSPKAVAVVTSRRSPTEYIYNFKFK